MQESLDLKMAVAVIPHLSFARDERMKMYEVHIPVPATFACKLATGISIPLVFISVCRATSNSLSLASPTVGYARSKSARALMTAEATTILVNHLLSAGITYHGASLVAVLRIVSSYACM